MNRGSSRKKKGPPKKNPNLAARKEEDAKKRKEEKCRIEAKKREQEAAMRAKVTNVIIIFVVIGFILYCIYNYLFDPFFRSAMYDVFQATKQYATSLAIIAFNVAAISIDYVWSIGSYLRWIPEGFCWIRGTYGAPLFGVLVGLSICVWVYRCFPLQALLSPLRDTFWEDHEPSCTDSAIFYTQLGQPRLSDGAMEELLFKIRGKWWTNSMNTTLVYYAINAGRSSRLVKLLLDAIDTKQLSDVVSGYSVTLLHVASMIQPAAGDTNNNNNNNNNKRKRQEFFNKRSVMKKSKNMEWDDAIPLVDLLLMSGCRAVVVDEKGYMPLHTAVVSGHYDAVDALTDYARYEPRFLEESKKEEEKKKKEEEKETDKKNVTRNRGKGRGRGKGKGKGKEKEKEKEKEQGKKAEPYDPTQYALADLRILTRHGGQSALTLALTNGRADIALLLIERGALLPNRWFPDNGRQIVQAYKAIFHEWLQIYKTTGGVRIDDLSGDKDLEGEEKSVIGEKEQTPYSASVIAAINYSATPTSSSHVPSSSLRNSRGGGGRAKNRLALSRSGPAQGLMALLEDGTFTDFTFWVEGNPILVHKAVIAGRGGKLSELVKDNPLECKLPDAEFEPFQAFIQSIYVGYISNQLPGYGDNRADLKKEVEALDRQYGTKLSEPNRAKTAGFNKEFEFLLNNPVHSDVKVVIQEETFYAHKVLLSYGSEYFRRMFQSNMMESTAEEISFDGLSRQGWEMIARYLYTKQVVMLPDALFECLFFASQFLIEGLVKEVERLLLVERRNYEPLSLLELAENHSLWELKYAVTKIVMKKTKGSQEFVPIAERLMKQIILPFVSRE